MTIKPETIRETGDIAELLDARSITHIKIGLTDTDGVLRGKYLSREKFLASLEKGLGFCDVLFGWDSSDHLFDQPGYTGWQTGYPDAKVRIVPESCRDIPGEPHTLFFLCELAPDPADAPSVCPRGVLKHVIGRAEEKGFHPFAALEYEFFLFDETPDSVREKGFRNLKPITPGNFGYSILRSSVWSDFYRDLLAACETMRMPIEGLHTETGPGVLEAAITVDHALEAADRGTLFKTFTKVFAQKNDMMATFMARWSPEYPGQSGHTHISLQDGQGQSVFYDANGEHGMSQTMRHFLGGLQALLPEFLVMIAPTVNSYTRLVPGFWAPTNATWGVENRTTALRVIGGSPKSQRIESRVPAADANPYLAVAATLGAGLWGIEHKLEPTERVVGNAYDQTPADGSIFPTTLWEAAQAFKKSTAARSLFGDAFVDHFVQSREWEEREFRRHTTDWELNRYFEII